MRRTVVGSGTRPVSKMAPLFAVACQGVFVPGASSTNATMYEPSGSGPESVSDIEPVSAGTLANDA